MTTTLAATADSFAAHRAPVDNYFETFFEEELQAPETRDRS
jgi:hypothetical protein